MEINFDWSIDQWIDVIKQFFEIIANFFAEIGIQLFPDEAVEEEEPSGK